MNEKLKGAEILFDFKLEENISKISQDIQTSSDQVNYLSRYFIYFSLASQRNQWKRNKNIRDCSWRLFESGSCSGTKYKRL